MKKKICFLIRTTQLIHLASPPWFLLARKSVLDWVCGHVASVLTQGPLLRKAPCLIHCPAIAVLKFMMFEGGPCIFTFYWAPQIMHVSLQGMLSCSERYLL